MEANEREEPRPKSPSEEVAALWAKLDQRRIQERATTAAEQSGRLEAAAEAVVVKLPSVPAGASLCNTHPHSSQVSLNGFPGLRAAVGLDWWEVRAAVEFKESVFAELMAKLEESKRSCQDLQQDEKWLKLEWVPPFRIYRMGLGGTGEHFEYKIDCGGIDIGLGKRQGELDGQPNLLVRMSGRECLLKGTREAYEQVKQFVGRLGATFLWEKLSRVDVCMDVANLAVRSFKPLIDSRCFITRAKSLIPYENAVTGEWTGFAAGKRPLRLIVYDKLREQAKKADDLYLQALIQRRYEGSLPDHGTRLEFQMSRQWLLDHGVSSPDDFLERQSAIIEKLTREWFRVTAEPVVCDAKHQSRAAIHPLWISIGEAFSEALGMSTEPMAPVDRKTVNPLRLIKQGFGCLRNAALQCGFVCLQPEHWLEVTGLLFDKAFATKAQKDQFLKDYFFRQTEYAA
ncbi:MAG: hypothetical protein JNK76_11980 [Planctomycetales bacterium]|nr:hypothetical protein [Planctomycetales bacterium]MBN8627916.1 hypothetical protein [Planctomycetota bacterium]